MMNFNRLFLILLPVLFCVGCEDSMRDEPIEITDFYFDRSHNSLLSQDIFPEDEDGVYKATLPKMGSRQLIATYKTNASTVLVNNVEQQSGVTINDFTNEVTYSFVGERGSNRNVKVKITWIASDIPHITITTTNGQEITSKEDYLTATISIDGKDLYADYSGTTEIRGRGNSTWSYPKKPYRIKLTSKSEILGLPTARNWVLLANYLDPSFMCNSVALKMGRDLDVPFTNSAIPVDLTVNDTYRGSYVLTQHIEVNENRVNVGKDGYLLELDVYFDEDYQFYSDHYSLPVMIKNPELVDESEIAPIKTDFENFEALIKDSAFPDNNYGDHFDIDVFARYMLVCFMTANGELNHPKSTYMHKTIDGKFTFGPLWDFDWAFGYSPDLGHFSNPATPLLLSGSTTGTVFFTRLFEDPAVKAAFKNHWMRYKQEHLANLYDYIDDYAESIAASAAKDEAVWKRGKDFDEQVNKMKTYIQNRAEYIDSYVAGF